MTDLFILLAAVTIICTGAAIPCFFKSSRNTAGCLILSAAVLAASAACFLTPLKMCFASLVRFDIWYYSLLFVCAFIVSLFYRPLLGIALVLYALWCSAFLIVLLPAGYSPSGSIGEITVSSGAQETYPLEKITLSPYHLFPFGKTWYKGTEKASSAVIGEWGQVFLKTVGAGFSEDAVPLPKTATYPHVYFLSADDEGNAFFETVF